MTLVEQAAARLATAEQLGCVPTRWIATATTIESLHAADASVVDGGKLLGVPIAVGEPCSEWGLQLLLRAAESDTALGLAA